MPYDVVIAGGGPAGLAAALLLGRARKRVLLCDAGTPRNAAAVHVHGFVTRDGITPAEFRRIGRQQLEAYPDVEAREVRVEEIRGERGAFDVRLTTGRVQARRILLCTGMIDELPEIDGFRALWGTSIFQCPYCHGWEIQNQRFGYLATKPRDAHLFPAAPRLDERCQRPHRRQVCRATRDERPPHGWRRSARAASYRSPRAEWRTSRTYRVRRWHAAAV